MLGDLGGLAILEGQQSWGAGADIADNAEIFKNDLVIPKIWTMQALSEFLSTNKELRSGDFVSSLTGEKLASPEEGVSFVVVKSFKKWQAFSMGGDGKKQFEREYGGIMTLENANWPYEEVIDGKEITRRQVLCFIVLLDRDVAAGNPQPYVLEFAASSKPGGRKLVSALKSSTSKVMDVGGQKMRLPAAAFAFKVTAKEDSFDVGGRTVRVFVKDVILLGYSNKAAVAMAKEVYEFVRDNEDNIEYDERDVISEAGQGSSDDSQGRDDV